MLSRIRPSKIIIESDYTTRVYPGVGRMEERVTLIDTAGNPSIVVRFSCTDIGLALWLKWGFKHNVSSKD